MGSKLRKLPKLQNENDEQKFIFIQKDKRHVLKIFKVKSLKLIMPMVALFFIILLVINELGFFHSNLAGYSKKDMMANMELGIGQEKVKERFGNAYTVVSPALETFEGTIWRYDDTKKKSYIPETDHDFPDVEGLMNHSLESQLFVTFLDQKASKFSLVYKEKGNILLYEKSVEKGEQTSQLK